MKTPWVWVLGAFIASGFAAEPAGAQVAAPAPPVVAAPAGTIEGGGAKAFLRDVGGDYKHFFSKETAGWLGVGAGASLGMHVYDEDIRDDSQAEGSTSLSGGQYGLASVQVPLALAWWLVGSTTGNGSIADGGRDLLRAQISAISWTYVAKFSAARTRPNGDPRSFPSGHASSAFATAMVLQEHYGWKAGLPGFAVAAYTGATRVTDNKHWASDVVFGAFLGVAAARTVTVHLRDRTVSFQPSAVAGGGAVLVSVRRSEP
jgi:hypothetical protein